MDSERCNADLTLDFLPGLLGVGRVVDVKQRIVYPRERLSCIFIMAAGSENHVSKNRQKVMSLNGYRFKKMQYITR